MTLKLYKQSATPNRVDKSGFLNEVGDVSLVNDEVIEVGQCFSVEPGIYIYDEGIGVRIEDIVLITEDGCERLNVYPKDEIIVVPDGE